MIVWVWQSSITENPILREMFSKILAKLSSLIINTCSLFTSRIKCHDSFLKSPSILGGFEGIS